ncbi:MAG: hypothetical protein WCX71_05270 [Candidatus Buchananbacteria bacterium]
MSRPTYPVVFYDEAVGQWKCEMRDKKTARVWGIGYGACRKEAIYRARNEQPEKNYIKKAIGWIDRHPFFGGVVIGAYLSYHHAKKNQKDLRLRDMVTTGLICGSIGWAIAKLVNYFRPIPSVVGE